VGLFERMKDDHEEWDLFDFQIIVFWGNIFCC
jgi:hypothetical protein